MATISVEAGTSSYSFNIQPETAAWSYTMNMQSFDTYDGRVVQLLSCSIDSFSVEGYIPPAKEEMSPVSVTTVIQPNKNYTNINDSKIKELNVDIRNAQKIIAKIKKQGAALKAEVDKYEKAAKKAKTDEEKKKYAEKIKKVKARWKELKRQAEAAKKSIEKYEKQRDRRYSVLKQRSARAVLSTNTVMRGQSSPDIQWRAMKEFEQAIKEIMAYHEMGGRNLGSSSNNSYPAHFKFAEVGWEGDVFLTGYSDVRYEPDIAAVRYTLRFEVLNGFDDIRQAVSDQGLENIPDGVGWVRNVYNTPNMGNWESYKTKLGEFVDGAGTYDADNPADFVEMSLTTEESSESSETTTETAATGNDDTSFLSGDKVLSDVIGEVRNTLERNGLVPVTMTNAAKKAAVKKKVQQNAEGK